MDTEYGIWRAYVKEYEPQVFPGMAQVIRTQRELGGAVVVVTHSDPDHVRRDWAVNDLPMPDLIFGGMVP